MLENRNLKQDLIAIGLFGVSIFLGLALFTYDPADPVSAPVAPLAWLHEHDPLVLPERATTNNACGRWGAWLADACFHSIGYGAYFGLLVLTVVDLALLGRRPFDSPWLRTSGFLITLLGLTTLLSLLIPDWSSGPVIGSGGYLGALGSGALRMHFATLGATVLALSVSVCGLLLLSDYELLHLTRWTVQRLFGLAAAAPTPSLAMLRRRRADAVEGVATSTATAAAPSIRISGKPKSSRDDLHVNLLVPERDLQDSELEGEEEEEESEEVEDLEESEEADEDGEELEDEADEEATGDSATPPASATAKGSRSVSQEPHFKVKGKNKGGAKAKDSERDDVMVQLDQAARVDELDDYSLPDIELLLPADDVSYDTQETEVRRKAKQIEKCFSEFGFQVKVVEIETGPVIAQYEIQLEAGLRLSKITGLADDLAIALRVPSVRIVAPIPGKNTVGIEVPNETRQIVRLREVMEEAQANVQKMKIPLFLGKDVSGNPLVVDLAAMPHLLIAGRTGTGKSVCLNAIISSMLMTRRPDEVRMLMIDPKMVELSGYGRLPHLMHPVVTDMKKAEAILAWAVEKMEERYALLARAGVRHIVSYNQLGEEELMERLDPESDEERAGIPLNLPFIVIVADEIADLMMTAGKEVEQHIIRLAQKSRAVGIHLILATQKPTVDVITGLIKSNLPARLCFQVASRTDSRVVLDEMGADKLLGNGDMLFLWPGTSTLLRGQGTYLSDDEIESITDSVSKHGQNFVNELVNLKVEKNAGEETTIGALRKRDELYESAIDCIIREQRGSVSLLQRTLGIGYGRAARLIDFMCEDGIVGPYNGSQAREILLTLEQWEAMQAGESAGEVPKPADAVGSKNKRNRISMASQSSLDKHEEAEEDEELFSEDDDAVNELDAEDEIADEDEEELDEEAEEEEEVEEEEEEEEEEFDADAEAEAEDEGEDVEEEEEAEEEESDDDSEDAEDEPVVRRSRRSVDVKPDRFRPSRN